MTFFSSFRVSRRLVFDCGLCGLCVEKAVSFLSPASCQENDRTASTVFNRPPRHWPRRMVKCLVPKTLGRQKRSMVGVRVFMASTAIRHGMGTAV